MARLAQDDAEIDTVEPYYPYKLSPEGKLVDLDYRTLAVPVDQMPDHPTR